MQKSNLESSVIYLRDLGDNRAVSAFPTNTKGLRALEFWEQTPQWRRTLGLLENPVYSDGIEYIMELSLELSEF